MQCIVVDEYPNRALHGEEVRSMLNCLVQAFDPELLRLIAALGVHARLASCCHLCVTRDFGACAAISFIMLTVLLSWE